MPKLEQEPRVSEANFFRSALDWMKRATVALNPLVDAIGTPRSGTSDITTTLDGPAFRAYIAGDSSSVPQSVLTPLALPVEDFDTNNCYNPANGRFTPNVAGLYQASGLVYLYAPAAALSNAQAILLKNGATYTIFSIIASGNMPQYFCASGSDLVYLNGTTDYIQLAYYGTAAAGTLTIIGANTGTHFSAHLARRA